MSVCNKCSHDRQSHEHYRSGSDCAECPCKSFARSRLSYVRAVMRRISKGDAPISPTAPAPKPRHGEAA